MRARSAAAGRRPFLRRAARDLVLLVLIGEDSSAQVVPEGVIGIAREHFRKMRERVRGIILGFVRHRQPVPRIGVRRIERERSGQLLDGRVVRLHFEVEIAQAASRRGSFGCSRASR